jgi:hypothetical protein
MKWNFLETEEELLTHKTKESLVAGKLMSGDTTEA